jgi:hypothetical protein
MGEIITVYGILVRELQRKRPLRRTCYKWEGNAKMDVQEIGCENVDWIYLAWDRDLWCVLVSTVMNSWGSIKGQEFLINRTSIIFSRRSLFHVVS